MIHYDLRCGAGHEFDGWFKDSAAFATQAKAGFVECPACGSTEVVKQLMAPAIPKKGRGKPAALPAPAPAPAAAEAPPSQVAAAGPVPAQLVALLQKVRAEVEKSCDYVGKEFAEEARRIHRGESDRVGIYGEASPADAEALRDEGIEVARIPWVPRAD
ncbi:DUF1178 family protein [Paeniroseomonas aquatica]|uniref:DUF1178 family protein n=1 Tax=Paeniroseomonas aquatica TaxID=373043 RepID=A0ABT8AAM1_9PROT|nr:DUF1178 family protein [Paeniroseomonas aquatica]MDN3566720.1 DUF1178 family protein [Paeniroseomonas aquatica]